MKTIALIMATLAIAGLSLRAQEGTYKIDPVHSSVIVKVVHLGASNAWGRFNDMSGSYTFDPADLSKSMIAVEVKAGSVDTANAKRDEHLRGPDFFNAKQFPLMTFKSKTFRKIDEKNYEVEGDFTVRGITKPVTAQVVYIGTGKDMGGKTITGWDATFTINRSDFGITYGPGALSEEVVVMISLEGAKQ
jgi:polyisoprenoid-binding protein YceI